MYTAKISTEVTPGNRPLPIESVTISFSDEDMKHITNPHDDALIYTKINNFDVNSTNIPFLDALMAMWKEKRVLKNMYFPLIRFVETTVFPVRAIR